MTTRRGFLGSILGLITIPSLDWVAKLATDEPQRTVLPYHTSLKTDSGIWIQGPAVVDLKGAYEPLHSRNLFLFQAESVKIKEQVVYTHGRLCGINGETLSEHALECPILLHPGDTLNLVYSKIYPDKEFRSFEECHLRTQRGNLYVR